MIGVLEKLVRSREGRASILGVLIYGFSLGYFVWYTFFDYVPRSYPVSWQASWITYSDEVISQSYYRKKIYLSQSIRHGWIKVMAPDKFDLYVNGTLIGTSTMLTEHVTGYFDLSGVLKVGTNVIAVSAHRSTFPGTSKIAVEGFYEDWQGVGHKILSDERWRVNRYPEFQLSGGPEWFESAFEDIHWKYAKAVGVPTSKDRSKVLNNPLLYTDRMEGHWAWGHSLEAQQAYFRYSLSLGSMPEDAWIKISAQGYHLIVNGIPIAQKQKLIGITGEQTLFEPSLDIYNVAPYLKIGKNTIAISAVAEHSTQGVLVDGLITGREGNVLRISTPRGWKASSSGIEGWALPGFDDSHWAPAITKALLPVGDTIAKEFIEPLPPDSYVLLLYAKRALCMLTTAFLVILSWVLAARLFSRVRKVELVSSLTRTSLIYVLWSSSFLVIVFLNRLRCAVRRGFPVSERASVDRSRSLPFVLALVVVGREIRNIRLPFLIQGFRYKEVAAIGALALFGFILRFQAIDDKP